MEIIKFECGCGKQIRVTADATKAERIEMRVSPAEKELNQRLADRWGVSVTKLLVALASVAASRISDGQRS